VPEQAVLLFFDTGRSGVPAFPLQTVGLYCVQEHIGGLPAQITCGSFATCLSFLLLPSRLLLAEQEIAVIMGLDLPNFRVAFAEAPLHGLPG